MIVTSDTRPEIAKKNVLGRLDNKKGEFIKTYQA